MPGNTESPSKQKPDIRSAKILLAEDQPIPKKLLLKRLFELFQRDGDDPTIWENTHVTWVQHGHEAIDQINTDTFDLILLDNQLLDDISGFDIAIYLRRHGYTTPIVLITSSDPREFTDKSPGLSLHYAHKSEEAYHLTVIESRTSKPDAEIYTAYFSSKPCNADVLKCILKENFEFPHMMPPGESDGVTPPHFCWENIRYALAVSQNPETGFLEEEKGIIQLRLFHHFLTTRFPENTSHPLEVSYGHIPQTNPKRHMVASTFNLLLTLIPKKENATSPDWVSDTMFIIEKLLQDIQRLAEIELLTTKPNRETASF